MSKELMGDQPNIGKSAGWLFINSKFGGWPVTHDTHGGEAHA